MHVSFLLVSLALEKMSTSLDDDNRIVLKPLNINDCQTDYINACYVDVSLLMTAI